MGGVADLSYPSSKTRRGRVQERGTICPTITATETGVRKIDKITNKENHGTVNTVVDKTQYRIRKLTPKECWRLMGFSDDAFEKAKNAGISNTQLYKQAGNSIVTHVLYHIYMELYKAMPYLFDDLKVGSYFSGIGAFETALDMLYENENANNFYIPENKFYGWTDITIGDWTGKLSYIDDVPVILLDAFINVLSNQKPEVVYFDGEGVNYWIVFDLSDTIIITEDENCQYSVNRQDVGVRKLGIQMMANITDNIKAWTDWAVDDNNAEDCEGRKELLYNKLKRLRDTIYLYESEQHLSALGVVTKDIFADLSKLFNKAIKECDNENHQTRRA